MPAPTLTLLDGKAAVVAATGDDPYPRYDIRDEVEVRGWVRGDAVAWAVDDAYFRGRRSLTLLGRVDDVAALVPEVVDAAAPDHLRVPRGAMELLPDDLRPRQWADWDWWWSTSPPPAQAAEPRVAWLGSDAHPEITALLTVASPTSSATVEDDSVLRWCGVRGSGGELVACAADVRHVDGVPHLASIAVREDLRGHGLGAAVTAWISRRCFEEGAPAVTFGMYAWNDPARRMYRRLGFVDRHAFSSARLPRRGRPSEGGASFLAGGDEERPDRGDGDVALAAQRRLPELGA